MTTLNTKTANFHNNFVKSVEPSEKQIQKLAEFGYDAEFTKLFVNAVNWIVTNDNQNKSMKFFKKNQPLVDEGLAELFEEDNQVYLKLTNKADKIMSGKKNKINVAQLPRQKVKQSKGYVAKEEIPELVKDFLKKHELRVKSTELTKATYNLKCHKENSSRVVMLVIYESHVKFCFFGKYKEKMQDSVLSKLDATQVLHTKMSNTFGFVLVDQQYLSSIAENVFDFDF